MDEFVFMSPAVCQGRRSGGRRSAQRGGKTPRESFVGLAVAGIVRRMARPIYLSAARLALVVLTMSGPAGLACTSDDLIALTEVDPTTGIVDTTSVNLFTTGEPDETTTGEPMMGTDTCRGAVSCVINCAINLPDPPPAGGEDYSCFLPCIDDMTTEEWLALLAIGECTYNYCKDTKQCPDVDDKETCLNCLITSLPKPGAPGCEQQGEECK